MLSKRQFKESKQGIKRISTKQRTKHRGKRQSKEQSRKVNGKISNKVLAYRSKDRTKHAKK